MDFVALLSGGKDSCYNIHHCLAHGHRLLCLASLVPPRSLTADDAQSEELHSFMYQSAGSSVIDAYGECMGVPLLTAEIKGKAVDQSLHYSHTHSHTHSDSDRDSGEYDEVEDLFLLLQEVKRQFPTVRGVSVGAIVSNYQRLRVDHVCARLGLTPLVFLWQRDRETLLEALFQDGIDAVLVKVAGAGLSPEKHLGKSLRALYPTLQSLHRRWGLDLCGEGGEYESLVLDAPFFRKRIVIEEQRVFVDEEDPAVGNLKVLRYRLEEKETETLSAPQLAQSLSESIAQDVQTLTGAHPYWENMTSSECVVFPAETEAKRETEGERGGERDRDEVCNAANALSSCSLLLPTPISASDAAAPTGTVLAQRQTAELLQTLKAWLAERDVSLQDVVFVHLYLRDISLFAAVNEEYCKYFGAHPPSRSCVVANLPQDYHVALDAIYSKDSYQATLRGGRGRVVLHVQGVSEWAPLCIGPYSQCNALFDGALCLVAGQIPLDPAAMTLRSAPCLALPAEEIARSAERERQLDLMLAARHVARVLNTQSSSLSHCVSLLLYVNTSHPFHRCSGVESWASLAQLLRLAARENYAVQREFVVSASELGAQRDLFADDMLQAEQDAWSEDEESGENDEQGTRKIVQSNALVVVLGVPGLPRDASLEVEAVAVKEGMLPHLEKWTQFHKKINFSSTENDENSLANFFLDVHSYPQCLCHGSVSVFSSESSAEPLLSFAVDRSLRILRETLNDRSIRMRKSSLRCLRVLFPSSLFALSSVNAVILAAMEVENMQGLPVVPIPCSELEENCVFKFVFQCMDFEQIETMRWIANS